MKSPPLNALYAFEAFARRGRMGAAADELGVSHGAVSRHVRHLEALVGVALVRGPKTRLTLTEAGLKLADQLTTAFRSIEIALPEQPSGVEANLHVSCPGTLAIKWLIPRLPGFHAAYPKIQVRLSESYAPCDFRRDAIDLAIRVVSAPQAGVETTPIMEQLHGPVLSPTLLKGDELLATLSDLPRLYAQSYPQAWDEWQVNSGKTLGENRLQRPFEHNTYMIEAAAAGLGVAICPWAFVMEDLQKGRLVAPFGFVPNQAVFAVLRPETSKDRASAKFRDWLVAQGQGTLRPSN